MMRTLLILLCLVLPAQAQAQAVKIAAPASGFTCPLGSPVDFTVWTKPGLKVTLVTLIDQDGAGLGMTSEAPYKVRWETAGAKPGMHNVKAQITLADGRTLDSQPIWISLTGSPGAVIREGTPVLVSTQDKLVSGDTPSGSIVRLKVERDVLGPGGEVLIARGAAATGTVTKSEASGIFGQAGALDFTLDNATAVDGTPVRIRAVRNAEGDDAQAGVIAGGVLLSWVFIFMEGDDVEIPAGTFLNTFVAQETKISKTGPAVPLSARSVRITTPADGASYEEEKELFFACEATPPDDQAWVRVLVDGEVVGSQMGKLSRVLWNTYGNEALTRKVTGPGEHVMTMEVTWSNGQIATSPPVKVYFKDGPW